MFLRMFLGSLAIPTGLKDKSSHGTFLASKILYVLCKNIINNNDSYSITTSMICIFGIRYASRVLFFSYQPLKE